MIIRRVQHEICHTGGFIRTGGYYGIRLRSPDIRVRAEQLAGILVDVLSKYEGRITSGVMLSSKYNGATAVCIANNIAQLHFLQTHP